MALSGVEGPFDKLTAPSEAEGPQEYYYIPWKMPSTHFHRLVGAGSWGMEKEKTGPLLSQG